MTEHLTEQQIEFFRQRRLAPDELRAVHRHLAVCVSCRQRLSAPGHVSLAFAAFERELQQVDAEEYHLHYQQLSDYVDDELGKINREIVESHLEACAECTAEMSDLRAFKATITAKESEIPRTSRRREQSFAWWNRLAGWNPVRVAVAITGLILILTAAFLLLRTKVSEQDQARLAPPAKPGAEATVENQPPSPTVPPQAVAPEDKPGQPSDNSSVRQASQPEKELRPTRAAPRPAPSPSIVVALRDGHQLVTLDSRGQVSGVAANVPGMRRLLDAALRSGRLEKPPVLDRLIREPGTQLDSARQSESFALERPVGTVVESARPTFSWGPLAGASGYVVSVFDAQLREVARSDSLSTTTWTSPRSLPRGAIYRWQVIAVKDGREIIMPSPTAPEAKFRLPATESPLTSEKASQVVPFNSRYSLTLKYRYINASITTIFPILSKRSGVIYSSSL